ncbi:TonB-dependent receptor [Oceanicoccus sp. KOV_DT_Chl]|uniref:TonB-dependent receptor n=1 Tax=Oceanicoccus sp. KOV_DT_Chl TaxID=1904639 RepID=UPI000C7DB8BD|nr:TonB-dependent receptor [Oceanicoccus sp. KOV_DT_Chl]
MTNTKQQKTSPPRLAKTLMAAAITIASSQLIVPHTMADNIVLEEIIITARKQFETVQDVPVSVSSIGFENLQKQNITNLEELSASMPNVTIAKTGADDSLFIRGVGSGVNLGFERSIGTYVDGVYLGRGKQSRAAFLDLQRVEVLKGPQGILFGKNTIGGAINITSVEPTIDLSGYVDTLYEPDAEEWDTRFAVSNALTDNVRGRIAGRYHTMDGFLENQIADTSEPDMDEYALRGTLIWDATDELEVAFRTEQTDFDETGSSEQLFRVDPINPFDGFGHLIGPSDATLDDKSENNTHANGDIFTGTEIKSQLYALTLNYQTDDITLTSITAFSAYDADIIADADYSIRDVLDRTTEEQFEQLSQEFRVLYQPSGDFEYLAGVYLEQTELEITDIFTARLLPVFVTGSAVNAFDQQGETLALFGQVDWSINDNLSWSLGLRYGDDKKEIDKTVDTDILVTSFAADHAVSEKRDNAEVTWSSILKYNVDEDVMIYGSVGTGYKDGGYDQFYLGTYAAGGTGLATLEFGEETVESIEIGMKSTLLDGAMTLNMAMFRSEYEDLQTSALSGVTFVVVNAGESVTQGVEMDVRYAVNEHWIVGSALSYLDASYADFNNAACTVGQISASVPGSDCAQDLTDAPLQYAPDFSGNINIEWVTYVSDRLEFSARADINYSDSFFTAQDEDAHTEIDAFTKINVRLALAQIDGTWELAIIGKNLTDEETSSYINDAPINIINEGDQGSESYFARTDRFRTVAIQGIYRF